METRIPQKKIDSDVGVEVGSNSDYIMCNEVNGDNLLNGAHMSMTFGNKKSQIKYKYLQYITPDYPDVQSVFLGRVAWASTGRW
jgi:hypothetical protein